MPSSSDLLTEFTDFVQFFVWLVVSYSQQKLFLTLVSKPKTRQIGWRDLNTACFESWQLEAILSPYSNQMLRNEWPLRTNQNPWQQVLRSFHPKETKPGTRTQSLAIWQVLEYCFSRFEIVVISNLNRTVLRIPFLRSWNLEAHTSVRSNCGCSSFKSGHKLSSWKFCRKLEFSWTRVKPFLLSSRSSGMSPTTQYTPTKKRLVSNSVK